MFLEKYSAKTKKIIAAAMVAAGCLTTAVTLGAGVTTAETVQKPGDVDSNGEIDLDDVLEALKYALKVNVPTPEIIKIADVSPDGVRGEIDLDDVLVLLKAALKVEDLPVIDEPTASPTKTPYVKPIRTPNPGITQTMAPTSIPMPVVTPGVAVEGTKVSSVTDGLNGAEYDKEKDIYTFTQKNKDALRGIKFENPWAGKTSLVQSVEDALPKFFCDKDNKFKALGVIKDGNVVSLDGKTVIGKLEQKDGEETAKCVEGDKVIEGTVNVWSHNMMDKSNLAVSPKYDIKSKYDEDYKELYARPQWSNGVSISFWAKYKWSSNIMSDAAPFLVIKNSHGCDTNTTGIAKGNHTNDFAIMVRLNGGFCYEGDESGNTMRATNFIAGKNEEWNYYTVTIANDWITVYVNGQELVYNKIDLNSNYIEYINNGFMSRYNPIRQLTKDEVDKTEAGKRGYLNSGFVSKTGTVTDILDMNYEIIDNSRYSNPTSKTIKKNSDGVKHGLILDLIANENTELWFGSSSSTTCVCLTSAQNTGDCTYDLPNDTQLSSVICYDKELTAAEVSANYEKEKAANATKLGLK